MSSAEFLDEFRRKVKELMAIGATELEAHVLAVQFIDKAHLEESLLYREVKNRNDISPYSYQGRVLEILSIRPIAKKQVDMIEYNLALHTRQGRNPASINLRGMSAAYFLALMVLKFREVERDLTRGFPYKEVERTIEEMFERQSKQLPDYDIEPASIFRQLRRKFQQLQLDSLLEIDELPEARHVRLSIAPTNVEFSADAQKAFEQLSSSALARFREKHLVLSRSDSN